MGPIPHNVLYWLQILCDLLWMISQGTAGFILYITSLMYVQFFQLFTAKVENLFDSKIKCFRSDSGGEFLSKSFQSFLNAHGIIHRLSCHHTPEQNSCTERKHRHMVEIGRTLLSKASIPHRFWVEAFQTAVYLINRLPSQSSHISPWQQLFKALPKYHTFKVFGCACYPWLKPYA